jgi:hypothetical protein
VPVNMPPELLIVFSADMRLQYTPSQMRRDTTVLSALYQGRAGMRRLQVSSSITPPHYLPTAATMPTCPG